MAPLSTAEQRVLNSPDPRPWVFALSLPGGDLRVSKVGFVSATERLQYRALVKDISFPKVGAADYGGNIAASEMSVTLNDARGEFAELYRNRELPFEGSAVLVREAVPQWVPASWRDMYTGIVSRVEWPELMTPRIVFRVDDSVIKHDSPKSYARTTLNRWPAVLPSALNGIARIVYGTHNSLGFTGKGFVKLDLIDKSNWVYGPILGRIMDVMRVYGGDKILPSIDWSWQYTERRGTWYTTVTLADGAYEAIYGDQWTSGDAPTKQKLVEQTSVTIDCRGYGDNALGSDSGGALITNPIDQLIHFLTNFVIGSWRRGPWLATSNHIGDYTALRTFLAGFGAGFKGSKVIDDVRAGDSQIQDWLKSFSGDAMVMAFWDADGKLYFRLVPVTDEEVYKDGPAVFQEKLSLSQPDDSQVVSETILDYIKDSGNGSFITSVTARDPSARVETPTKISQEWGSSE